MRAKEETVLDGRDSFMAVRHLTLRGSNFEIGQRLGELARERYGQAPSRYAADPTFARARRAYLQRSYPVHWERVRGVASAFGLDPEDERYDLTNLTYETNAFWRYRTLAGLIAQHERPFTLEDLKHTNACVNVRTMLDRMSQGSPRSIAANVQARTLWHSIYDQQARTVQVSFYLRDQADADAGRGEVRSEYLEFALRVEQP